MRDKKPCSFCDVLTPEQKLQISTPSYQNKKEKREQKAATVDKSSENVVKIIVDPSLVTVVGVTSTAKKAVKSPEKTKHSTPVMKSTTDGPNISVVLKRSCCQSLWKGRT